jgi:hypothetical protein
MSATPSAATPTTPTHLSTSSHIPIPGLDKRHDGWRPSPSDISATPGGTMFAMTPGGTKLQWSRSQLMHYANSPLSKSPLHLPRIPGVTLEDDSHDETDIKPADSSPTDSPPKKKTTDQENLFDMDD